MQVNITVTRYGMTPEQINQQLDAYFLKAQEAIEELAIRTQKEMHRIIDMTRQRQGGTGNLQRAINVYPIENGYGVGSIDELNRVASYWYIINYGGFTTVASRGETLYGFFNGYEEPEHQYAGANVTGNRGATDRFDIDNENGFPMRPKFPIWPHNYIERTATWLSTVYGVTMNKALNSIKINRISSAMLIA